MNAKLINQTFSIIEFLALKGYKPSHVKAHNYWYISMIRPQESTPSFKVDAKQNLWYDHGMGIGGTLIDLACTLFDTHDIAWVMKEVQKDFSSFHPALNSVGSNTILQVSEKDNKNTLIIQAKRPIQDIRLIAYLQKRGISREVAQQYCIEVQYDNNSKTYVSLAFANNANGYELRSEGFKSCIAPKHYTYLNHGATKLCVFEGFLDFLSYQMLPDLHIVPSNFLVLNSLALLPKVQSILESHTAIYLFLDNDIAGKAATKKIWQHNPHVIDMAVFYADFKDLNDYLTHEN
jgi:Toprim-like